MEERLQKILSQRGVASRRHAEELIEMGKVSVNGTPAHLGDKADPDRDRITVNGKALPRQSASVYLMLNKPKGVVTTLSDEKGRPNAAELVKGCGTRVWPIGRLDMDSEGLLLFTNDGDFSQRVAHPGSEVEKCYRVWVTGYSPEKEPLLSRRVELDGYVISQPKIKPVRILDERAVLDVTIHEGRNRQVRRMCAMAGLNVVRLVRVSEGPLHLGKLPSGTWRYLTEEEILALKG